MRDLEAHGLRTTVIEARNRIGGRIHTVRDERLSHAIELGAEFIHGSAPALVELVNEARLAAFVIEGERWRRHGGRLAHLPDFWKRMQQVMARANLKGPDRSFDEFLADRPGGPSAAGARAFVRSFVESYQGADASKVSARAMIEDGIPSDDSGETRMMRIPAGYDLVPEWLARGYSEAIMKETVVEEICWEKGNVSLSARWRRAAPMAITARAAIVTVPLGVLLAPEGEEGTIRFSPPLKPLSDLGERLAMGPVVRVVILFRERWWGKGLRSVPKGASLDTFNFLMGDTGDMRVWWSLHPAHLPALVGWVGGPQAKQLAALPEDEIRDRAISSVAANFGVQSRRVASLVEGWWMHNWVHDPYARGAYSYPLVGGARAAVALSRPIERTIWLAGEAADGGGRNGTVHGAIDSGRHAAKEIVRSLT